MPKQTDEKLPPEIAKLAKQAFAPKEAITYDIEKKYEAKLLSVQY